jgi:hypothetical protein
MDHVRRATDVLKHAEIGLRDLVSKAATNGDYDSVVKIASWAGAVSDLLKRAATSKSNGPFSPPKGKENPPQRPRNTGHPVSASMAQNGYPRFFRQGDTVVRVAWSKREKDEYQHKAPQVVLRVLGGAMARVGADGRVFSTDDFLPIRDADGSEIPSYQAYVGIALLKQAGLIDQHGRQGYSIPRLAEFPDSIEAVLKKLPAL